MFLAKKIKQILQINQIQRIMARKKIHEGSVEEQKKMLLGMRIAQIRQNFFDDNNRLFSEQIDVNEQALSQICSGKRNAGIEIVQKILDNMPTLDANWLLLGRGQMLVSQPQSFNITSSPQSTINTGEMKVEIPVGIVELLNSQQETIKKLTSVVENLSHP